MTDLPQLLQQTGAMIRENVEAVETEMLKLPQAECSVTHRFGPGIYIREVRIPAGTLSVGHYQRTVHVNNLIQGRVTMLDHEGKPIEVSAPFTYVGRPGRKIGYIHEDMVWQNIYATDETDIEKLEAMFIEKSDGWMANKQLQDGFRSIQCEADRADYRLALAEFGFTEEVARTQSENDADRIEIPANSVKVIVSESPIEGSGLFATAPISEGEIIAPSLIGGKRTIAGRFTNHARNPNAVMVRRTNGDIDLVATRDIAGCYGGEIGEEVTIDYRQALSLSLRQNGGF